VFDKILIANRGEIACRIIQTARRLGVASVAVYSEADRGARHVALAEEAVPIGAAAAAHSYLNQRAILEAARRTGAQAIHPGYGFLSENPDFAAAVKAAGLVFIGPSADAIRAMGLKDAAKCLMEAAKVPVVPGYHGERQDADFLAKQARQIGYPVLIKAVAGGGGKGMRQVEHAEGFSQALAEARGEALAAFGNEAVLIEKFIPQPRHIEIQVFGDGLRALHLFERDCSLQRRHQKVIEEAPAPGMPQMVRDAMGQAAIRAAQAIGYCGAGTVEFIADGSGDLRPDGFWFMEMNTRLQVEHPVTEMITGVDLVEWQLRVAAGEPLPLAQEDLHITGHSFEARLYAEDVPRGFLPATGPLTHLAFADGCRVESGVQSGDSITPFYDPMIAKIITHGPTRAIALARLRQALAGCQVAGTTTNLAFLGALARHKGFGRGEVDTGLIARDLAALIHCPPPAARIKAQAALAASGLMAQSPPGQGDAPSDTLDDAPSDTPLGFTLWQPLSQAITLRHGEDLFTAQITARGEEGAPGYEIALEGTIIKAVQQPAGWRFDANLAVPWRVVGDVVMIFADYGRAFIHVDPLAQGDSAAGDAKGDTSVITAPMSGVVKAIFVTPGQAVRQGEQLAVLEAMKMEHALFAPRDAVVEQVLEAKGAQVAEGTALVRLAQNAQEAQEAQGAQGTEEKPTLAP